MKAQIKDHVLYSKIPSSLVEISQSFGTYKKSRTKLLKVYATMLFKVERERKRRSKKGHTGLVYVPLSSKYFERVFGKRYYKCIQFLKANGFITAKGYAVPSTSLFGDHKVVESYKVGEISKQYTVLIEPNLSDDTFEFPLIFETSSIVEKNENFLTSIGVEPKITTDNYGYRLYHPLTTTYKTDLSKKGDFVYYDFKSSVPHHIKALMIKWEFEDSHFLKLFDGDFYENWGSSLGFSSRSQGKDSFLKILYGQGKSYCPLIINNVIQKYPKFWSLVKRDLGKKVVREETRFVFDEVIKNMPTDKVLTIHDGFFICKEQMAEVDEFLLNSKWINEFPYTKEIW